MANCGYPTTWMWSFERFSGESRGDGPNGPDHQLSREQQENLREKLLAANPAELKVKIEHDADLAAEPAPSPLPIPPKKSSAPTGR